MTIEYPYTLAQLARILSALEAEPRNPNTKTNAIKAIERNAARIGLTAEDIFDAADGLLSGRIDAIDWRAILSGSGGDEKTPAENGAANEPGESTANDEPETPATSEGDDGAHVADGAPTAKPPAVKPRTGTKQALMIEMLRRDEGATIDQIAEATGWRRHTCRGAISGALKKKLGLAIVSGTIDGQRVYRIDD